MTRIRFQDDRGLDPHTLRMMAADLDLAEIGARQEAARHSHNRLVRAIWISRADTLREVAGEFRTAAIKIEQATASTEPAETRKEGTPEDGKL